MPTLEDITDLETDAPVIEEASDDEDEPSITELAEARQPPPPVPPKPRPKPDRDGVALTEDLIRRKAEHNEGMLSTLEEIALHQLDIDKIESLNNCRCLKIVLLQGNLIRKIENLHKLKQLDYLNLALNNITRIENLERCEALTKLDLTVNFIDLDELHTVGSLKNNTLLRDLTLMGNPCAAHWESGYRDYVIGTLPQLERFDGTEVSRTERIKALQRLPELERELALLVPIAAERKAAQRARFAERERKIASGELVVTNETTDEWCPEIRVQDARELREIEEEKTAYRKKVGRGEGDIFFRDQQRERTRFFRDDGTPIQMNTAKWPFSIEEDGLNVYVDVALPRFLDSAAVDADVQPLYVRVSAKKNTLQLVLPAEVLMDSAKAERSSTTGHLLLTCPKLHPISTSKAPAPKKSAAKAGALPAPSQAGTSGALLGPPPPAAPGAALKGAVDVRSIVASSPNRAEPAPAIVPTLGPDFDDEDEVPPLL